MADGKLTDLHTSAEHWELLGIVADDAGCDREQYIIDGLVVAMDAAKILLSNRQHGKDQTGLLLELPDGGFLYGDLAAILTEEVDSLYNVEIGVLDPFVSDKKVPIPIDDELREEIIEICETLGVAPLTFIQAAIDLRRDLQVAGKDNRTVYIETTEENEYFQVPTSF